MNAHSPSSNLLVIRCTDIERAVDFYRALGLVFTRESHGGPAHYSSRLGDCVFELYPLKSGARPSTGTRLGFVVSNLAAVLSAIIANGGKIVEHVNDSTHAVIEDIDGHRIELSSALEP